MLSRGMLDDFNYDTYEDDGFYDNEMEIDSTNTWEDDDYVIEKEMDSVNIDSMIIEEN